MLVFFILMCCIICIHENEDETKFSSEKREREREIQNHEKKNVETMTTVRNIYKIIKNEMNTHT